MKIVSVLLFIKSFLISHDSSAATFFQVSQSEIIKNDSVKVKIVYKNISNRIRHEITIYENNELIYESFYPVEGIIYLPDSLKPNDKIKVKVNAPNKAIITKTYRFRYSEAETYTIKIVGKNEFKLFKRPYVMGCPSNFW